AGRSGAYRAIGTFDCARAPRRSRRKATKEAPMSRSLARNLVRPFAAAGLLLGAIPLTACQPEAAAPAAPAAAPAPAADAKPAMTARAEPRDNRAWWPEKVDLSPLRRYERGNPYGASYDYAAAFAKLDLAAVKAD